jgi:peroxiredoxin
VALAPGTTVPEFTLQTLDGPFTRDDLPPGKTVLIFYPNAFSSVCTDQLRLYDAEDFGDAQLYGVSCDGAESQRAFKEHLGVSIPMLSDFEPKGATCRAFDAYHPAGIAQRALIVIEDRVVTWSYQGTTPGDLPPAQLVHEGLAAQPA